MNLFNVGRICLKIAGRDAGLKCVVLSEEKNGRVLVDGETRRREVSINHLEPLAEVMEINAGAEHSVVTSAFDKLGIKAKNTKVKASTTRPVKEKVKKNGGKKKAKSVSSKDKKVAKK